MNHARLNELAVSSPVRQPSRFRQLAQRGLTTVEYAVGLLAAATVALVLFRIFSDNAFFKHLFDWVVKLLGQAAKHV